MGDEISTIFDTYHESWSGLPMSCYTSCSSLAAGAYIADTYLKTIAYEKSAVKGEGYNPIIHFQKYIVVG